MKYPILSRIIIYSSIVFLSGTLLLCLHLMKSSPYNEEDMRRAYVSGCQLASRPLSDLEIEKCSISGDIFKDNLRHFDEQYK